VAIGTWKEATTGTATVADWSSGKVYFWDGISLTYNFAIDVSEGQINAMFGNNTELYMFAGWRGDLMKYEGGYTTSTGSNNTAKLKPIPLRDRADYIEIYPGAMNMWRSMLHFGVAGSSNSTTIARGVYSWGTINVLYPDSLSLDYPISTGNIGNTVSVGLVYPIGKTLLVGWQDGIAYGCDQVNFSNAPASYGTIQNLLLDFGSVWKQQEPLKIRADYKSLATGESVNIKYKVNREANWHSMTSADSTIGSDHSTLETPGARGKEFQMAVDMYSLGATSPTLLSTAILYNDLSEEDQF
jgi:hypothetical protein